MSETIYSFSRLNSYHLAEKGEGCFWNFYKTYLEGDRGINNYFGEYGTMFHEIIEDLLKGNLYEWDIKDEINRRLRSFNFKPPFYKMGKSYETAIHRFFDDGSYNEIFDNYKVLEAEEEKLFDVDGVKVKGFPDLVAEHKKYDLVIGDYKTAARYTGDKLEHNIMQLYMYSIPIFEKYGRYPDHLIYIFPRESGQKEFAYKFDHNKLEQTKRWVVDTTKKIESNVVWNPRCKAVDGQKDFFACNLCNHRESCEFRNWIKENDPFGEAIDYHPFK
ncbi:hypothetical protein A9X05_09120 [Mycobacterium sp. E3298]|nr:hypothetical protein A9X05_09120 [Mycobacterium sp. E3298]